MAGIGEWIGPLIFLGIAGYGVYAYSKMAWPFDGSIMLPGLGGGTPADMSGLPMDGSLGGGAGGMGVDCMGAPCTCAMEGVVSYATALELAKKSSKSSKSGSSTMPPASAGMIPDPTMGGLTPYAPAVMPSGSCPCDCSGGGGAGGAIDMSGLGGGGGGSSGGGGHSTKSKSKKHSSSKKKSSSSHKKKSSSHHSTKKSHYATYGDYGGVGADISAGVPIQDYISGFARYGDYGNVGNAISADADPFRKSYYASYGDYGPVGAMITGGVQPADYSAYESVYGPEDAYNPVQYGYAGQFEQSRPNYNAGFLPQASNRNPLAEVIDRGIPVAIS